jgi:hypothetical protein
VRRFADAAALHREIRQLGFAGGTKTVRRYLQPLRATITTPPATPPPPKVRHVARWIMINPDNLQADDRTTLDAICQRSPALRR